MTFLSVLLCIFSFTVFIVNEYFTTITKLKIYAHHLLLTIILSILKCAKLYRKGCLDSPTYWRPQTETEWKSSSLNRTVCGVIFNVRIGKEFGLKNSVFAAFVSTRVTLVYSCVRFWHLCPHQQVSQTV
jgi:hypothetical protein